MKIWQCFLKIVIIFCAALLLLKILSPETLISILPELDGQYSMHLLGTVFLMFFVFALKDIKSARTSFEIFNSIFRAATTLLFSALSFYLTI